MVTDTLTDFDTAIGEDRLYIIKNLLNINLSGEQEVIVRCPARKRLVAGGERGGKSRIGALDCIASIVPLGAKLIWLYGNEYDETSMEYQYIIDDAHDLSIFKAARKNWNPGLIELDGGIIVKTVSGQDLTKIGREAPDYILVCEAAKISQMAYQRLGARLAEKRGFMLMTGTFEGSLGWYPELFQLWQVPGADGVSFSLPTWSNLAVFPGGRDDPEILAQERELPKEIFLERFGGVPCPPTGLVFKEFKVSHHVMPLELDKNHPVYLWADPGYASAYAVEVVQIINDQLRVIDEVYVQNRTTRDVIQLCKMTPDSRDAALNQTFLPHCDNWWPYVHPVGVMDIAGSQHQANESVAEIWASTMGDGAGITMRMQQVPIIAGTERYRDFLKVNPLTGRASVVISPRCRGLISEHGGCHSPITGNREIYAYPVKDGVVISETPEDKNNHAIKAMIYGIVDRFGYATRLSGRRRSRKY